MGSIMICENGLPFINDYVDNLNKILKSNNCELTKTQSLWMKFILLGILVTNTVCWNKIERFSIGAYKHTAISWMFINAKLAWNKLLRSSVLHLIEVYKITSGVLAIDDTGKNRSKNTTTIATVHKVKDKKTAGYVNAQELVYLLLIANGVSLPVGFRLYEPDPMLKKVKQQRTLLKAKKVAKQYWPVIPMRSKDYPTKPELALSLLSEFVNNYPQVKIIAVVADALYSAQSFVKQATAITKQKQIITEIRSTQNIIVNNVTIQVAKFFKPYHGTKSTVQLRYNDQHITYVAHKCVIKAHAKKYWVIALKYDNEENYRYIIATDMSYLAYDVIKTFALRWLIEVFIQDWKAHEGWNSMAKQPGVDGSIRGIILSLLCDHALLTHPQQIALYRKWEPACTVGSLREKVIMESLLQFMDQIINSENPAQLLNDYKERLNQIFQLRQSTKHMRNNYFNEINVPQADNLQVA